MVYTNKEWTTIHQKIINKVESQLTLYKDGFPDGVYDNSTYKLCDCFSWTCGFWPAMLFLAYKNTKKPETLSVLRQFEKKQNEGFNTPEKLHHDVGFMWYLTSAQDYNLTGFKEAKVNAMNAAAILASRFNPIGGYLRAWNDDSDDDHHMAGWAIIDCMINLELLYWASEISKDARFANIANAHADSTIKNFVRPDGTTCHIVAYNPSTGAVEGVLKGQGYSADSAWSRGMSWAAYGFIKAYGYTGNEKYKEISQLVLLGDGNVPPCDFFQPDEPHYLDSSAGAVVACALLDNAKHCPEQKDYFINEAKKLLAVLTEKCADFDVDTQGILRHSTRLYHGDGKDCTLIYGHNYYMEAIDKLVEML